MLDRRANCGSVGRHKHVQPRINGRSSARTQLNHQQLSPFSQIETYGLFGVNETYQTLLVGLSTMKLGKVSTRL